MITPRFFVLFTSVLFVGMLICILAGSRVAIWQQAHKPGASRKGTGSVDAAVFGLMGLLLAFTFSAAAGRFEARRHLIEQEANLIGTAYLRLDLLPAETQPDLRDAFRRYVRSRLAIYEEIPDDHAVKAALRNSESIQDDIWRQAVAATTQLDKAAVTSLVLSNINDMLDITTTRTVALYNHTPLGIIMMLGVAVLAASLLAGYNMSVEGSLSLVHVAVYVVLVGVAVYVILDLEYPRIGLLRIDPADWVLAAELEKMK